MILLWKIADWHADRLTLTYATFLQSKDLLSNGVYLLYEWVLISALGLTLPNSLRALHFSTKNSLRGGFWGAWLLSSVPVAYLLPVSPLLAGLALLSGFLAAFGGALAATAKVRPLWEENLPPSPEMRGRVLELHRAFLGMELPTPAWKRVLDLTLCLASVTLALPLALLIAWGIWLEDPGAIFFIKNSVGKGGRNFRQLKFRTMIQGAEEGNGPTLARENDPRALRFGRILRKTALDELPQLWNILRGEMSFVGPRPQRTALVDQHLQALPQYAERHRLPPGLSGLAQVAGSYYLTPLQKLRFDRLYIRHASLGYDLRLLAAAFALTFYYRWKRGWNGRLPRRWLQRAKRGKGDAKLSIG